MKIQVRIVIDTALSMVVEEMEVMESGNFHFT
jgi:hypothetical protein